jgi:hypothetical protein
VVEVIVDTEITVIVDPIEADFPIPDSILVLAEFVAIRVLVGEAEVDAIDGQVFVAIDLSGLDLTPEELAALVAVVFDPETGAYTIILGGYLDGYYFMIPVSGPGLFGVIITDSDYMMSVPILEIHVPLPLEEAVVPIDGSSRMTLRFVIGSTAYDLNGIGRISDTVPFIHADGEHMLPLAVVVAGLGGTVQWMSETRTVLITYGGVTLTLQVDTPLDGGMGMPVIVNGRTFVPATYVSEILGANVIWDVVAQAVYVTD